MSRLRRKTLLSQPRRRGADPAADLAEKLKVGVPYTGVYTWYLQAQVDLANGEYDKAQNTMAMFNNAWAEYLRWYCQRYDPVQEG